MPPLPQLPGDPDAFPLRVPIRTNPCNSPCFSSRNPASRLLDVSSRSNKLHEPRNQQIISKCGTQWLAPRCVLYAGYPLLASNCVNPCLQVLSRTSCIDLASTVRNSSSPFNKSQTSSREAFSQCPRPALSPKMQCGCS